MTFRDRILYMPSGPDTHMAGGGAGGNELPPSTMTRDAAIRGFISDAELPAYRGMPHADPTNAFFISKEGQHMINSLLSKSTGGNADIGVINNIKDNPIGGGPQSTVGGGAGGNNIGIDQLNYFQNKPLAPRSTFMTALENWSFNVPMQNLWAVVFDLPPILRPTGEAGKQAGVGESRVDDILYTMGEFNKNAGRDMNARRVIKELDQDIFQKVSGCLFAQSVIIPGESVQMTWQPPGGNTGGLIGFPLLGNRQQFTSLNIGFRETNLSFIDFVMRPWLILASHLGLTERHPLERLGVKSDIHVIQFAKAGAALKKGSSYTGTDAHHENLIPLLPRKIWRFKDCTPIRVPQGDYSYSETSIETKTVEFIYSHYEVRAPDFYINSAISVADGFVDDEAVTFRPATTRTAKAREAATEKIKNRRLNHGNKKRRGPEHKSKELEHQKEEFEQHNDPEKPKKHRRLMSAYGGMGKKVQERFDEATFLDDPVMEEVQTTGYTAKQRAHAKKEFKQHNKPEKPKKHPRLKSGYAGDNLGAEPGKREGYTGRQRAHAEYRHDTGNKRDSGADRILGDGYIENREKQTNDAELQKTWSLSKEMRPGPKVLKPSDKKMPPDHHSLTHSITHATEGEAKKGPLGHVEDSSKETGHADKKLGHGEKKKKGPAPKVLKPSDKKMKPDHHSLSHSIIHGTEGEAKEGPLGHVEDSSKETGHADKKLGHGKARKMPAAGGYRWNQGSKGLFGWL